MRKILVTGGAGFIGSALIRYIINETDFRVVNVDKLSYAGNLNSLLDISNSSRYEFEQVDICDKIKLVEVFDKHSPDAVIHLAAESHVDRSINGPDIFMQTNIMGTYTLLETAREYWSKLKQIGKDNFRLLHVSTDEVYGDLGDTSSLFTEESRYKPSSPYSASKAASDHLVSSWFRTFYFPTIITNCSNNYGPFQHSEKLIPLTISNALSLKKIPVYGKGNQIRDWLFVDDHVKALMTVLLQGELGETYNIGGHNEKTNIDVVMSICNILDEIRPSNVKYKKLIHYVKDRPGHDIRYAIDASKIDRTLSWKPIETFESGLRKTVLWYLNYLSLLDKKNNEINHVGK